MQSFNHSEREYISTPDEDSSLRVHDAVSIHKYQSSLSLRATLDYSEDGTSNLLRNVVYIQHAIIQKTKIFIRTFLKTFNFFMFTPASTQYIQHEMTNSRFLDGGGCLRDRLEEK
jgi:hypothetical protein